MITDSHCHLADAAFVDDLSAVVERARAAGLVSAVCILSADEADEMARAATVRAAWPVVAFAAAIHPHRAGAYGGRIVEAAEITKRAAHQVSAVAIGEIGLDYHYDLAPRAVQQDVFAAQVAVAGALGLPVVIHTREATDDAIAILRHADPPVGGVMHCFTGTQDEARLGLDLGFYISISGILTFPKATALRDVAAFLPADRLLIETDAPYLTPVPYRGKRNEPAWVQQTAAALASVRGVPLQALHEQLAANTSAWLARNVDTPAKPMV